MLESVRHRLAAAFRFTDAFTGKPVTSPLDVLVETLPIVPGMPNLPWEAVAAPTDGSYRFFVTNETVMPVGAINVTVSSLRGDYFDFEGGAIVLPLPFTAHPPTPARSDFLVTRTLWPTRSLKIPPGETAVVARVRSAGATPVDRLRVKIWSGLGPPPATPYTYTDGSGELVFRLPALKTVVGGVITPTATMSLEIRVPPAYVTTVAPTQIVTDAGTVLPIPFTLDLGRITNLLISIP